MSTKSWQLFIPELSKHHQLILVDFLDQGQSDRLTTNYKQPLQAELVKALLDHLEIQQVNLAGISYGGEIAIQFAIQYPERLLKLALFNTAAYTSPWLHDIGRGWVHAAKANNPEAFYKITIPIIYSPQFYTENLEWMKKREELLIPIFNQAFLTTMIRLIESSEGYDCREQVSKINVPTLIVGAENDYLIPIHEQRFLHEQIASSELVIIPECGHASMYEKPGLFLSLLNGFFLSDPSISVLS